MKSFFSGAVRLGKLERGPGEKPEKADDVGRKGSGREDKMEGRSGERAEGGSGGSSQRGASPSGSEPQTREKEKHEKKKKTKHGDDSEISGVAAAAGNEPRAGHPQQGLAAVSGGATASTVAGSGGGNASSGSTNRLHGAGLSVNDFISKTKNQQRQGLKPSGPELIAYARYLGIDPVADHDLLWIAVEALEAPLPSDWTEHFDSNDRVFYYNATMRVSSWTHPLEHIYRETYKTMVNFRNATMGAAERNEKLNTLRLEVKQMELDVHREIAQWTEHTDEQGNRFYFNREERQSTWTDPRPAKCQIFYLRKKMLGLMQNTGGTQGFAENKGMGSSLHPLGVGEFEDPAYKRPKVGATRKDTEGSEAEAGEHRTGNSSPGSCCSDSESDEERRKKKKKAKKKHKKHEEKKRREAGASAGYSENRYSENTTAVPPPHLGANLRNSQSEPTMGGKKALLTTMEEHRAGHGGLTPSASGPHALNTYEHSGEGLSNVGRVKVKAGIKLDPLTTTALPTVSSMAGGPMDLGTPKGVRNSASVPALQP